MKWKSTFDIKKYIMERNFKYTYDRQTIKYMGKVLTNKDITFEDMNSMSDITFDIVIEKLILQVIINEKILVYEIWHDVSSLIEKNYWIIHSFHVNSCNETAIINFFYSYGDDILAHVEQISNKVLSYVKSNLITLVDKTITKRIRVQTKRYCEINYNSEKKNKLEKEKITVIKCFF